MKTLLILLISPLAFAQTDSNFFETCKKLKKGDSVYTSEFINNPEAYKDLEPDPKGEKKLVPKVLPNRVEGLRRAEGEVAGVKYASKTGSLEKPLFLVYVTQGCKGSICIDPSTTVSLKKGTRMVYGQIIGIQCTKNNPEFLVKYVLNNSYDKDLNQTEQINIESVSEKDLYVSPPKRYNLNLKRSPKKAESAEPAPNASSAP